MCLCVCERERERSLGPISIKCTEFLVYLDTFNEDLKKLDWYLLMALTEVLEALAQAVQA